MDRLVLLIKSWKCSGFCSLHFLYFLFTYLWINLYCILLCKVLLNSFFKFFLALYNIFQLWTFHLIIFLDLYFFEIISTNFFIHVFLIFLIFQSQLLLLSDNSDIWIMHKSTSSVWVSFLLSTCFLYSLNSSNFVLFSYITCKRPKRVICGVIVHQRKFLSLLQGGINSWLYQYN